MWKKLFSENAAKNAVTLFHRANNGPSTRVLSMLKEAHGPATEGQSSSQDTKFELEVTESPPTGDQLRSILEFVGEKNIGSVIQGASNGEDAQRKLRLDSSTLTRPLTVDWNAGKVVVGDNETELSQLIKSLKNE